MIKVVLTAANTRQTLQGLADKAEQAKAPPDIQATEKYTDTTQLRHCTMDNVYIALYCPIVIYFIDYTFAVCHDN